jgi:hypothetical protein
VLPTNLKPRSGFSKRTQVKAAALQTARDKELQRAHWLADWKTKLISDLNGTGYGGVVTDLHGYATTAARCDGRRLTNSN